MQEHMNTEKGIMTIQEAPSIPVQPKKVKKQV